MEKVAHVDEVTAYKTKSGNTRYVLRDEAGNEYTTFKEAIARQAVEAEGRRARIEFHEEQRNGFRNVYLDRVEPLEEAEADGQVAEADEVAWKAAIDAAPLIVGESEGGIPARKLFEKLKPFKELVAEDIRDGDES